MWDLASWGCATALTMRGEVLECEHAIPGFRPETAWTCLMQSEQRQQRTGLRHSSSCRCLGVAWCRIRDSSAFWRVLGEIRAAEAVLKLMFPAIGASGWWSNFRYKRALTTWALYRPILRPHLSAVTGNHAAMARNETLWGGEEVALLSAANG